MKIMKTLIKIIVIGFAVNQSCALEINEYAKRLESIEKFALQLEYTKGIPKDETKKCFSYAIKYGDAVKTNECLEWLNEVKTTMESVKKMIRNNNGN